MNQEKYDNLLQRAKKYIGSPVEVGTSEENVIIHTFASIRTTNTKISEEKIVYDPIAILKSPDGKDMEKSLQEIVDYFERKSQNSDFIP